MENGCLTNRASCPVCSTPLHLLKYQWDLHSRISDIINPPKQREKMRQTSPLHFTLSALNKIFWSWKWETWGKIMCEVTKFNTGAKYIALLFFSWSATKVFEFSPQIIFNEMPFCQGGLRGRNGLLCSFFPSSIHWGLRKFLKLSQASMIFWWVIYDLWNNFDYQFLSQSWYSRGYWKKLNAFSFILITYIIVFLALILYAKYWSMLSTYKNKV